MEKTAQRPRINQKKSSEPARSEEHIISDLQSLCTQPGYVHAIAFLCFRDNVILYGDRITEQDMQDRFDPDTLLRTEISTLLGLMIKVPIDWSLPSPAKIQEYIEASDQLLLELHQALSGAFSLEKAIAARERNEEFNPFDSGAVMREPIFYAAESAYVFQYLDFAAKRYAADDDWLLTNVGFTIEQACIVAESIDRVLENRFTETAIAIRNLSPDEWSMLPIFSVTIDEIAADIGIDAQKIECILLSFTVPEKNYNKDFVSLQDFNQIAATPLLRLPDGGFLSLQSYGLAEAIYESPFFWMQKDKEYLPQRDKHRGEFTENVVAERLANVFGNENILTNIDIWDGKKKVAEIDVLVLWADRAIIIQSKSKRLTVEARKGNDKVIRDDFQKSVQDAYDQGLTCAEYLGDKRFRLTRADGTNIDLPTPVNEIFLFCVLSDHYPALSIQTRQFLKLREVPRVRAALVTDIFLIDVLTELLPTPLNFLSYIDRRTRYADRIFAQHELTILAFHLKHNLWIDAETDLLQIHEDFTPCVDIAMAARRRGLDGDKTPDGILTLLDGTSLGRIIRQIEAQPNSAILDQGFQLLELSSDAANDLSRMIDKLALRAAHDGKPHDISMMFTDSSGFTVVCSAESVEIATRQLTNYCSLRKYKQKADRWFGLCLTPGNAQLRFGLRLSDPWKQDDYMDKATTSMKEPLPVKTAYERVFRGGRSTPKIGRNDPCPCGSGRKWKKCCMNKP